MRLGRLAIRIGYIPGGAPPLQLQAAAGDEEPRGKWFESLFELKNLIGVVSLILVLVAMRVSSQSEMAAMREHNAAQDVEISQLSGKGTRTNQRINEDTVPRACWEHDEAFNHQLFGMLLQHDLSTPPAPLERKHP